MTSTIDAAYSLTSLGQSTRDRCLRLRARGWIDQHTTDLKLLVFAVVLPVMAVAVSAEKLKYGLAFVAGVALVSVVLSWPVFGGYLLVALVPSLSGLEPGFPVPNVRASEALIGVVGLTVILGTRRLAALRWGLLEWLLLGYGTAWALLGAYDALALGEHLSLSQWGTVFGQLQFFLLYRAVRLTLRSPRQRRIGLVVLFVTAIPMTVLAILQEVNVGGLRVWLWNITGQGSSLQTSSIIRATGLFANWASLAGFIFPMLVVLTALALSGQLKEHRKAAIALAALLLVGILLTAEMSAILCLVLGVFILGSGYGRFLRILSWIALAAAISLVVVGPVLGQRLNEQFGFVAGSSKGYEPQTVNFREQVWTQQYLPAIAQRPLDGYGVELPTSITWPYPESQYVAVMIEGGYPMLIMYLVLLWGMFDRARRASRSLDPFDQALGRSLTVCTLSLLLLGVIWPFLSNGGFPQVLWVLFALAEPATRRIEASAPVLVPSHGDGTLPDRLVPVP